MKKILLFLLSLLLMVAVFVACNRFEPMEDWEFALVEYLSQYPPLFYNASFRNETWGSWWESDWRDFVEQSDGWFYVQNPEYGCTYIFRDPRTGGRVKIDDVPYLRRNLDVAWHDFSGKHMRAPIGIVNRFELLDLDGDGIPALVIYWGSPIPEDARYPFFHSVTLHRFYDGVFEFVKEFSTWSVDFYRAEDGRLFVSYGNSSFVFLDFRLLHLSGEITTEPALSATEDGTRVYNHLTGEYFERYQDSGWFVGLTDIHGRELFSALLGIPLAEVEKMDDVQRQMIRYISARLRNQ